LTLWLVVAYTYARINVKQSGFTIPDTLTKLGFSQTSVSGKKSNLLTKPIDWLGIAG